MVRIPCCRREVRARRAPALVQVGDARPPGARPAASVTAGTLSAQSSILTELPCRHCAPACASTGGRARACRARLPSGRLPAPYGRPCCQARRIPGSRHATLADAVRRRGRAARGASALGQLAGILLLGRPHCEQRAPARAQCAAKLRQQPPPPRARRHVVQHRLCAHDPRSGGVSGAHAALRQPACCGRSRRAECAAARLARCAPGALSMAPHALRAHRACTRRAQIQPACTVRPATHRHTHPRQA